MSGHFRLATGGRIDREEPRRFTFDGKTYHGLKGDTLASALLANGVHLVGRSFKYHRPRGIVAAGSEEPNALVTVDRGGGRQTPNLRATQVELYQGLAAASQNRWPSLGFDLGAVTGLAAPLLPAGFYYKTFMWPAGMWSRLYEPAIRAMAGLGRAPDAPDPDHYATRYRHCDVLVVGAGPAGLAAALAAAEAGARVILCDEQPNLGGSLLAENTALIEGQPALRWLRQAIGRLVESERVTLLPRTTAFAYYTQNFVALAERVTDHYSSPDPVLPRERLWQVRARQVILATGAHERPLVFSGNDRPGIMLAEAARTYLARYGVKPGTRAVVATAGDTAYRTALELHQAGVPVGVVADLRPRAEGPLPDAVRDAGIRVETGTAIIDASGSRRVRNVRIGRLGADGTVAATGETIACDLVAVSGGWTPAVHLHSQSRAKVRWEETRATFLPGDPVQQERSAGACRGIYGLAAALQDGAEAGEAAAKAAGLKAASPKSLTISGVLEAGSEPPAPPPSPNGAAKAFVDFQNDVTTKDLALALREGFRSIEHVKRYTTTGMATDQGKTSNLNALALVAAERGEPIPAVGLTTFRPPYTPVTFGTLASFARGDLFDPVRTPPSHDWAEANGAVFENVGMWRRARWFRQGAEDMHAAVARECRMTRAAAGMLDASTLGKIEVAGPDAETFLNRIYTNDWSKTEPGRCGYGLMLKEDGYVFEDGVVGRLAPDLFHVTTSTGGAAHALAHMEDYLQTEWPDLDVWLTSTTEQWAVIALQGPLARKILEPFVEGADLSAKAMPMMSVRLCRVFGVPTRLFRVSFTGELGFELNVPAEYGASVWELLHAEVVRQGGVAYGTETMHVLRAEKGYIIVGQETDGTVTPDDLGLTFAIGKDKADFVGKRSLQRPDLMAPGRKQLVGLLTRDPAVVLEEGAQIVAEPDPKPGTPALGHVTSSYWSAALGRSIALALVADGRNRMDALLHVPMPDGPVPVTVAPSVLLTKAGPRNV